MTAPARAALRALPLPRRGAPVDPAEALAVLFGRVADVGAARVFAALRRHRPVARLGPLVVVTLRRDVEEVLADPVRFPVSLYTAKMEAVTGPFLLGMDDTPLYRHDRAALDAAFLPADLDRTARLTLEAGRRLVGRQLDTGLDVVTGLADPVLDLVVGAVLGATGPDPATHVRWARDVFEELFIDVGDLPAVRDRALASAAQWRRHLDGLVRDRRRRLEAGDDVPDDVLTRLLQAGHGPALRDLAVRHNLLGLVTGWIPTVSNAFARVVEELLHRPQALRTAQAAARDGDTALVAAHVFEASRFRPQNVALLRRAAVDSVVAAGTPRATEVPAGTLVVVATLSAMHDETAVEAPAEFRLDRPWDAHVLFGHGPHTCYGQQLVRAQLPALATALLEGPALERAAGRAGRLTFRGPFPSGLVVRAAGEGC